jgi:hypothetical protein
MLLVLRDRRSCTPVLLHALALVLALATRGTDAVSVSPSLAYNVNAVVGHPREPALSPGSHPVTEMYYQKKYNEGDLHPDDCDAYIHTEPANMDSLTGTEKCQMCDLIVKNSFKWNWKWHYSALCHNAPRHLQDLCKHYACVLTSQCPEFITGQCNEGGASRFPCPSKYVCWNCLHLPDHQYAGCFDGTGPPAFVT